MLLRPTWVRAKFDGFHISAHDMTRNPPDFRPKPSARVFSGRMQYAPTRVRAKFGGFHISSHEYAKNVPDFTFPNKDTPKTRPVLGLNLRRSYLRVVCNTPLHGHVQNLAGSIFSHPDTPKTHPILDLNLRRETFRGVCFCAPTRVCA